LLTRWNELDLTTIREEQLDMKKLQLALICISISAIVFSGCSSNTTANNNDTKSPSSDISSGPVTLKVLQLAANISDSEFKEFMVDPVKKKYPNISLELIHAGDGTQPAQLVASGSMPDLIFTGGDKNILELIDLGVPIDLTQLLKENSVDIGKFDPVGMDMIKNFSSKGELLAVPFSINFSLLYYNKDIFDKFALAYPKDGMTWEQAIDLTKKVTRTSDGVQYLGLDTENINRFGMQMSVPFIDYKTNKAALTSDGWKRAFEVYRDLKAIPGNVGKSVAKDAFIKDRNLAMLVNYGPRIGEIEEMHNQGVDINYDIATVPTFKEAPGKAWSIDLHLLMVSSTSKYKQEAAKVLAESTSTEVQLAMTRKARLSSLKDANIKENFGKDLVTLKGKNIEAIFKLTPAAETPPSVYKEIAKAQIIQIQKKVLEGTDINTALREAEETANEQIAAEMQRRKQ
jgi:multiple sugar transport system substrate-binding protein